MFSPCPKYRLQTPLVMCVKLLKTASLGAQLDCGGKKTSDWRGECRIGLKPGSHSGVELHAHTHTKKKIRLGLGNLLIPISAPVWSVRAPALQGLSSTEPVHTLLQTLRTDVLLWKYSTLDFDVFQRRHIAHNIFFADWKQAQTCLSNLNFFFLKKKKLSSALNFFLCDQLHSARQMQ